MFITDIELLKDIELKTRNFRKEVFDKIRERIESETLDPSIMLSYFMTYAVEIFNKSLVTFIPITPNFEKECIYSTLSVLKEKMLDEVDIALDLSFDEIIKKMAKK